MFYRFCGSWCGFSFASLVGSFCLPLKLSNWNLGLLLQLYKNERARPRAEEGLCRSSDELCMLIISHISHSHKSHSSGRPSIAVCDLILCRVVVSQPTLLGIDSCPSF